MKTAECHTWPGLSNLLLRCEPLQLLLEAANHKVNPDDGRLPCGCRRDGLRLCPGRERS